MNPQHILIVDDEASIRELLQAYFQRQGYRVSAASTATEAHEHAAKESFSLVILDVVLGDADGMDVLEDLKHLRPDCPVLIMTGSGVDESLLREAKLKGASGYISKTLPLDQLLHEVKNILALQ